MTRVLTTELTEWTLSIRSTKVEGLQGMLNNVQHSRRFTLLLCGVAVLASAGCRSRMPRMNMFGWRSEPSAETLAGAGPTTTYPMPPSTNASPEAIASVAGGTAPPKSINSAPVTSMGIGSAIAQAPSTTKPVNYAAAQANGIYSPPGSAKPGTTATQPVGYTAPSYATTAPAATTMVATPNKPAVPSYASPDYAPSAMPTSPAVPAQPTTTPQPSGYVFGQKATAPTAAPATTPTVSMPAISSLAPAATNTSTSTAGGGGFTMPTGMTAPSIETTTAAPAKAPTYSTATQTNSVAAPAATPSTSTYTPGSTATAPSYPSGGYDIPSSGGTMYR